MKRLNPMPAAAILLLIIAVLAGCTAKTGMVPIEPLTADLSPYTKVVITTETMVTEDVSQEMTDLEQLTLTKLQELGTFEDIRLGDTEDTAEGTLKVRIVIAKIKKVSGGARFMLGAFAGRASMTTDVFFIDTMSGKELGSYTITGQSGGTGVSGGTSDAVKKTAEGIAKIISENYGK
jgi:hypothetical protein